MFKKILISIIVAILLILMPRGVNTFALGAHWQTRAIEYSQTELFSITKSKSGTCGNDATWSLENGILTISGKGNMYNYNGLTSQPDWYPYRAQITSIVIKAGINNIGNHAFSGFMKLTNVSIPSTVTSLGSYCFSKCISLTYFTVPSTVETIGAHSFNGCNNLLDITISDGVYVIGSHAFRECTSLISLDIPKTIGEIHYTAFGACESLSRVNIYSDAIDYQNIAFSDCSPDLILYCNPGSSTEKYAKNNGYTYSYFNSQPSKEIQEPDEPKDSTYNIDTILDYLASKSLIDLAREQAITQDYTPLASPALFKILLIGYTNVSYGNVTYSMTEAQKKYLSNVANNFKASVEKASGYNVTIAIDVEFCDSLLNIPTITSPDELIYIPQEYITDDLQRYGVDYQYDSVLTTSAMPDSLAILGVKTAGVENHFGYSYITLGNPTDIPDMSEPTALATLVAIHEWLHQLEGYRELLGIDFPDIHAYLGVDDNPEYANYEKYSPDTVGDWWYFYRDVLGGKVLYKSQKYIGMFPSMWYVTPRSLDKRFTIRNVASDQYLAISDVSVSHVSSPTNNETQWRLTDYNGYVRLMPVRLSGWCLDVNNAWAFAGNKVNLFTCWERAIDYINAQLWSIMPNNDGTFLICSKLDRSLVLSLDIQNETVLTLESANGNAQQSWIMELVEVTPSSKYMYSMVMVGEAPSYVTIKNSTVTLGVGETYTQKGTVNDDAVTKTLTYTSSNPTIATVTSSGKVTAKKTGTVEITIATYNGKKASYTITVKKAPSSIKLAASSKSLKINKKLKLKAKLSSKSASNKLTYTTSNKSIATVSSKGVVTAKKAGKVKIKVTTYNGKKASYTIKVTK